MIAKEKAIELYNKMAIEWMEGTRSYPSLSVDFLIPKNAYVKQCALIAVDEVINTLKIMCQEAGYDPFESPLYDLEQWEQVKEEIQKL